MNISQIILRKLPVRSNFLSATSNGGLICYKSTDNKPTSSTTSSSSSSSSESSDSDDLTQKKQSSSDAVKKLNMLLEQMVKNDQSNKPKLNLAQPKNRRLRNEDNKEEAASQSPEKQMINAIKDVASVIGGDEKKTESELLLKLLQPVDVKQNASTLSDIIKGMKIERDVKPPEQSKADQVRKILQRYSHDNTSDNNSNVTRKPRQFRPNNLNKMVFENIDLFGGDSLDIFKDPSKLRDSPQLKTWQKLHQRELKLAITHPPQNYFQEMILWTEQGKIWQFPINNEFGLEEESKVYFADHVFLEEHLEPWCPNKGPIRHFMELVCVGLSKNPYLTVEAKKEHINWYKNYFDEKRQLLEEVGAIPVDEQKANVKNIEKE